jgi:Domain of unknown function (DUF4177)
MYEYKIVNQRDKRSGTFDIAEIEAALNAHAINGWRLVEALLASNVNKTSKAEIVLILERPAPDPTNITAEASTHVD